MSRPELQTPPELFYNDRMSRKYNSNSRMVGIQAEISERCIELLNIPVRRGGGTHHVDFSVVDSASATDNARLALQRSKW